jgi:hypothetical protein
MEDYDAPHCANPKPDTVLAAVAHTSLEGGVCVLRDVVILGHTEWGRCGAVSETTW